MPVVPFTPPTKQQAQRKVSPAEESWVLMAAAAMDQQGRLVDEKVGASEVNPNGK